MKLKTFLLAAFTPLLCGAAEVPVDPSTFKDKYEAAADGDILVMDTGTYGGEISLPNGKTVTLKAAGDAEVIFKGTVKNSDASATGGGIVFDGITVQCDGNYFMDITYGDIKEITMLNCDISGIGRCFIRSNNEGATIDEIKFDNCVIHDCGANGYNFIYPKHGVKK